MDLSKLMWKRNVLLDRGQERIKYAQDLANCGASKSYVWQVYASGAKDILAVKKADEILIRNQVNGLNRDFRELDRMTTELRRNGINI